MLVGYVSDERYLALSDVALEFEHGAGSVEARSRASGAVYADLPAGTYLVTLAKPGYGSKRVQLTLREGSPYQFRLLAEGVLGYVWPKWVKAGEAAQWRVHAPEAYKLELWRYGYNKDLIRNIGWYDDHGPRATVQLTPDGDYTQTGIRWNQHGHVLSFHPQQIVAPERSGLYYLHAKTAAGGFFSFPWIVAPARPEAKVAVVASTLTWNAYNNFGGRSNYVNQDGLPVRPTVYARTELKRYTQPDQLFPAAVSAPLSYDRPELLNYVPPEAQIHDQIEGRLASAMAPATWRLLGWLEREGFEHDFYADTQLHSGALPLDRYRVLILDNHPEYWSKEMYFKVKKWVYEQGGKLLYLGGCGLYAEVEFQDDATILYRVEGQTELRRESEANLLGVAYDHSGYQSGAPYRVLDDTHWVFAGTELRKGDLFGKRSQHERCPGGASGHELDKISPHSPKNLCHLAKGANPGGGGADMVLYETASGGAVFAPGSLCWPLALLVDEAVSRVTGNVLRRFLTV